MSHLTEVKTAIKDLAALKQACADLGLELVQGTTRKAEGRTYGGRTFTADLMIRLKGPYDVGLDKQSDGTFKIVTDWWAGHVEKEIGINGGKLMQAYNTNVAMAAARKAGYQVTKQKLQDGSIKLVAIVR